jgi:uncharacterized membrane protein
MTGKKILLIISICAVISFAFVLIYDITNVPQQRPPQNQPDDNNQNQQPPPRPESPVLMVPLSGVLLIVAIVAIALYLIYSILEQKFERKIKLISKVVEDDKTEKTMKSESVNLSTTILNLLNQNERKIVKRLMQEKGVTLQSEISKMDNMGKVKAHRSIQDLVRKGIVDLEKYGNTNRILLKTDVKKILDNTSK